MCAKQTKVSVAQSNKHDYTNLIDDDCLRNVVAFVILLLGFYSYWCSMLNTLVCVCVCECSTVAFISRIECYRIYSYVNRIERYCGVNAMLRSVRGSF